MKSLFDFYSAVEAASDYTVIRVPKHLDAKEQLLRNLAAALQFPNYFGFNWDALDDCLSDLSWLPSTNIQLLHEDVPLISQPVEAMKYLKTLEHVLKEPGQKKMKVSFPKKDEALVLKLLSQPSPHHH